MGMPEQTHESSGSGRRIQSAGEYWSCNKLVLTAILALSALWPVVWCYFVADALRNTTAGTDHGSTWQLIQNVLTIVGMAYSLAVAIFLSEPVLKHRAAGFLLPFILYVALWTEVAVVAGGLAVAFVLGSL